ncbi:hypothetical protein BJ322DRAFT_333778 [Thelephora terrestris]|uniref:Secreted protein n=1 Tax=Thelephora terrestris TaxID=56493 RepID=A0A9P6L2V9_9AGAM|nr:hypothetical protein BJ322DRAFT_333778 [Thelephora terrestris]
MFRRWNSSMRTLLVFPFLRQLLQHSPSIPCLTSKKTRIPKSCVPSLLTNNTGSTVPRLTTLNRLRQCLWFLNLGASTWPSFVKSGVHFICEGENLRTKRMETKRQRTL